METTLTSAEQRRATLQAELAQLDGHQRLAVVQLTPAALERHLEGMTEKLRSGVNGKVREAIQQSVARILVGVDGSLTIETTPGGLLGVEDLPLDGPGLDGDPMFDHLVAGPAGRTWQVIAAPPDRSEL